METAARIPEAIDSLAAAVVAVPTPLLTINSTLLGSLLTDLARDLAPALPSLAQVQQEVLLTNSTFVTEQFASLSSFLGPNAAARLNAASSHEDAIGMVEIAATRYDILTFWAPDCGALAVMFIMSALLKVALVGMLTPRAIEKAARAGATPSIAGGEKPTKEARELARLKLQKPVRAALGHLLNLVVSTFALALQGMAWRLFVLPDTPIRLLDVKLFSLAMKLLLAGYAADLLFGDLRSEIFLHHFFSFALLFVGQLAAFKCQDPRFFRQAQYLILQGTLEQTTYAAMVAWHASTYLRLQGDRFILQRRLMRTAYYLMRVTKVITFPQKFLPAGFALYWLAQMWHDIDRAVWGRTWIVWCSVILALLLIIQVKFADDAFPLAAHMRHKLEGGPAPSRTGPVFTLLGRGLKRMGAPKTHHRPPVPLSPTSPVGSDDGRSRSTTITWVDEKVDEGPAVVLSVCGKESPTTPTFAPRDIPLPASTRSSISAYSTETTSPGLAGLPELFYDASSYDSKEERPESDSADKLDDAN
ncbi:hypothetical protein JCM3774_006669 [Rhodotorula dairenensis]